MIETNIESKKILGFFSVKMRCHDFVFLAILAIRVAFEANSMDAR